MQTALDFLKEHYEVAFATCEDNRPKLRLFQIMRHEGTTLYFATSTQKAVYSQLVANPHVEILAVDGKVSVRCEGSVDFDVMMSASAGSMTTIPSCPASIAATISWFTSLCASR